MKIIKYLFFLFLLTLVGFAVYFGTKDGNYNVKSTKTIQAPITMVFNQVNDLKKWQKWGPWKENDPNIKFNYNENTVGEGSSYSWESKLEGDGTITTNKVFNTDSIHQKITFKTPLGESNSEVYWYFTPVENNVTQVTWGMKGSQTFMEKIYMSFQDTDITAALSTMFNNGLNGIEKVVTEEMKKYQITADGIKEYGGGYYLYTSSNSKIDKLSDKIGTMYAEIYSFMNANNISQNGNLFTLYNTWDTVNNATIFSVGVPINEKVIITEGQVLCGFLPPLTAAKVTLKGNYTYLNKAHQIALEYLQKNGLQPDPKNPFFEVYTTKPEDYPNPADWVTEVYYPILLPKEEATPIN